ncbi:MAG: alpha/beta hydrolase [Clostridiales bacterium]|nr:alpha/beta hydrolase [Clostridiales bacterium]
MKKEIFTGADGKEIVLRVWDEVASPVGVLQIVHGMAEHAGRYDDFAKFMNEHGYIVLADDHRAHGETDKDALGLAYGNLFEDTVQDEKGITKLALERYGLPLVLMGHSYGSFLTQRYISYGTEGLTGCILMGSAAMEGFVVSLGAKIAAKKVKKGKGAEAGKFFAGQTFVKYDKKIKDGFNGWLSRDKEQVGKFNLDPLCNFTCSNGFYDSFFKGMKAIWHDDGAKIEKTLSLLIVSGDADGVGGYGKLVKKLKERYVCFGMSPEFKLFEGARHELLNETNREEVYAFLSDFVSRAVKGEKSEA